MPTLRIFSSLVLCAKVALCCLVTFLALAACAGDPVAQPPETPAPSPSKDISTPDRTTVSVPTGTPAVAATLGPTPTRRPFPTSESTAVTPPPPTPFPTPSPLVPPTMTPGITPDPAATPVPTPAPTPTPREVAAAQLAGAIPWFDISSGSSHDEVTDLLIELWLRDSDLGGRVGGLQWVADEVDGGEIDALRVLREIVSTDLKLARQLVGYPWFVDGVNDDELQTLEALRHSASKDVQLARLVADFARSEYDVGAQDAVLARQVAGLPWLADGVTDDEWDAVRYMAATMEKDAALAQRVVNLSWFADGINYYESQFLDFLGDTASEDVGLARLVADFSRVAGDGTIDEWEAIFSLGKIAHLDRALASRVAGLSWFADGVTRDESKALRAWGDILSRDAALAERITNLPWFGKGPERFLDIEVLVSLSRLARLEADFLDQLTSQHWFADGLDDEESALLIPISSVARIDPELYYDMLRLHYTQARTVSLPLAGDVRIWVFQNTPFPAGEDLVTVIEDTIRLSEEFLRAPFPRSDVILLVKDSSQKSYPMSSRFSGYFGGHMRLNRSVGGVFHAPHETAHYYFNRGPRWLREGAAEFIAAYYNDWTGDKDLASARSAVSSKTESCVDYYQMENIRHVVTVWYNKWEITRPRSCIYDMGENLLHSVYMVLGEEAMGPALGELTSSPGWDITEERIYETFMKYVPADRREDLNNLYRTLHGGVREFPDTETADDHGDVAEFATPVAVGQPVEGKLDYIFDFDYFRFQGEEGQKYRINVHHEALRPTSVVLYSPNGRTGENRSWIARDLVSTGPRIVWIAPTSDDYYFAVHNFGGKTGTYTIAITAVGAAPWDDHGDTRATATDIFPGEIIEGSVDDDVDIDYFRFPAVQGQDYLIKVESGTLDEFLVQAHLSTELTRRWNKTNMLGWVGDAFRWTSKESGDVYIGVHGAVEDVGTYRVLVSEARD